MLRNISGDKVGGDASSSNLSTRRASGDGELSEFTAMGSNPIQRSSWSGRLSENIKNTAKSQVFKKSKSVTVQSMTRQATSRHGKIIQALLGDKPLVCPRVVPLDLLFFRRIFSNLHRRYGNGFGEVPVAVFQRSVVRLFRVLGMEEFDFDASEYDADGSGAVGWYEFVTCWKKSKMSVILTTAERSFLAMEDPGTCWLGQMFSGFITILIFASCICFLIATMPDMKTRKDGCSTCEPEQLKVFDILEGVCVAVFTVEYILRFVLAPLSRSELLDYEKILEWVTEHEELRIPSRFMRLARFLVQPMNIIDLFVIAPFYLELVLGFVLSNLTVLRVLRLTRLCRLVKLGRYFEVLQLVVRVFNKSLQVLNILLMYLILGVVFCASVMYFLEGGSWDNDTQEYVRTSHDGERSVSPFRSIPHASWWCIVTFTTVGYGDVYPVTTMGKCFAAVTMLCGILVLAMPISAISMNFGEVWTNWIEERRLEAESRLVDVVSVTKALQGIESRSRLLLEVRDYQLGNTDSEFLGEVMINDLPVDSHEFIRVDDEFFFLRPNQDKRTSDRVAGSLQIGYTWTPHDCLDVGGGIVKASLQVRVQRAEGLLRSDWKKNGCRDAFVVAQCWPRPPAPGEESHKGKMIQTKVANETLNPVWNELLTFEFEWPKDWQPLEADLFGHDAKYKKVAEVDRSPVTRSETCQMKVSPRISQHSSQHSNTSVDFHETSGWSPGACKMVRFPNEETVLEHSQTQSSVFLETTKQPSLQPSIGKVTRKSSTMYAKMYQDAQCCTSQFGSGRLSSGSLYDSRPHPVVVQAQELTHLREVVAAQAVDLAHVKQQVGEMHGMLQRLEALVQNVPMTRFENGQSVSDSLRTAAIQSEPPRFPEECDHRTDSPPNSPARSGPPSGQSVHVERQPAASVPGVVIDGEPPD